MAANKFKTLGLSLARGIIPEFAPEIIRGVLIELFKEKGIDRVKATEWVEQNKSLWGSIGIEHREQITGLAEKLGDISWLNADWAINSLKDDFPALASLFLGWKKAHNWLERQMDEIKKQISQTGS